MQRSGMILTACCLAIACGLGVCADPPLNEEPMSVWMKRKLESSQKVLEGLALEDYDQMRRSAQSMQRMSALEGFVRRKDTEEYRAQLRTFRAATRRLVAAADARNLDSATLAFTQMTLSCVQCHQHLRAGGDEQTSPGEAEKP